MEISELKKLYENGDYGTVLEITKDSKEPQFLFFRISSFINMKKERNALDCLLDNRQSLFYYSPLKTIEANISLRSYLREFDEAYEDVEYYRNEKYISQEVEEVISGLKDRVRDEEKASILEREPEEIEELLRAIRKAKDDETILFSLTKMAKFPKELPYCDKTLVGLLKEKHSSDVKSFALMLLKMAGYHREVTFEKRGKKYALVPLYLTLPFMDEAIKDELNLINSLTKDSTIAKVASSLFNQYAMEIYPDDWMEEKGDETLIAASFLSLAMDYLQMPDSNLAGQFDIREIDLEVTKKAIQTVFDLKNSGIL